MQVKKFEARTMKEALEMVKQQLGPDAVILSAKDNQKSFGLVGERSVEITAAVSEATLQKKKFTESRLRDEDREKFQKSPARTQKQLMEKMVTSYLKENAEPRPITSTRYIEIDEDQRAAQAAAAAPTVDQAAVRIKSAAQRAWAAMQTSETQSKPQVRVQGVTNTVVAPDNAQILALKSEILNLKNVIENFNKVPQTIVNTHPGARFGLPYDLSFMFEKLTTAGVSEEITAEILTQAQKELPVLHLKKRAAVDAWVAKHILNSTQIVTDRANAQLHLFVGSSGQGKTSSLVKMASHWLVREKKKVAILTADTQKVGAVDQLKIYSQILNVPFAIIRGKADWERILPQLKKFDYVLVDFPGLSLKDMEEINHVQSLMPPEHMKYATHLVMSATSKDQDALEIARRYRMTRYQDVIFTGLDQTTQHGMIYNFQHALKVPIHSFGIGSRIPEDFEAATKERALDLIFKLSQWNNKKEELHGHR